MTVPAYMKSHRGQIAYHESGHVLLARVLGVNVDRVSIDGLDQDREGVTASAISTPHNNALVARGGMCGELLGIPEMRLQQINSGQALSGLGLDMANIKEFDAACQSCTPEEHSHEAKRLVETHIKELHNLASVLFRKGKLIGNEEIDQARMGEPSNDYEVKDQDAT
jgi:ATP-dependent Zn protease